MRWPRMAGWLHTEISVQHRELNPDTVAHLSTNLARRKLTSLIKANALTTMPDYHHHFTTIMHELTKLQHTQMCYCAFIYICTVYDNVRLVLVMQYMYHSFLVLLSYSAFRPQECQ